MELEKNQSVITDIISLGYNGEGISKDFDKPLFVPYALPQEKVKVKIIFAKKDFYIGKLEEIIISSNHRIDPICPVFEKCGGCQLQHLEYSEQLIFKQNHVRDCLKKIAGIDFPVGNTIKSEMYRYRNKFSLPFGTDKEGNTLIGMFANNSHRVIDIYDCPITEEWNKELIKIIREFVNKYNIPVYNETNYKGMLRHLVARKIGNNISVIIVLNGKELPHKKELVSMLQKIYGENFSLYLNVNTQRNNVILGEIFVNVYGTNPVDNFEGIITEIHPGSFYQVNTYIKTQIYKSVLSEVRDSDVIDAYSGAGTISNYIAKYFRDNGIKRKVYSIEIVSQAVEKAKETSIINGVEDIVTHYLGDCSKIISQIANKVKNSLVILDPPRKGAESEVLEAIINSDCQKICYISCDPATLARDLKVLNEQFEIISVTPYDMFPNTKHIETLAILKRK